MLRFRIQGVQERCGILGLGGRGQGLELRGWGLGCRVHGSKHAFLPPIVFRGVGLEVKSGGAAPSPSPHGVGGAESRVGDEELRDYSQVDILGSRFKIVNFGAKKSPGSPN